MRLCFALLFVLISLESSIAQPDLLIKNVTVVGTQGGISRQTSDVLVHNGYIHRISPLPIDVAAETEIIDGYGKFLTPGIMDGHVHVSLIPGLGFVGDSPASDHPELVDAYLVQQPRSLLYYGVTQVLDPNPGIAWEKFTDSPMHPDYLRCEVVASPRTYPMVEMARKRAELLYPYYVIEPSRGDVTSDFDSAVHPVRKLVERIKESDAHCIKLYFEDGFGDADHWPLLPDETIAQITSEAKREELFVLAHANALDMYEEALKHDIDMIVHGLWNWSEVDGGLPIAVKAAVDELHNKEIGFMPTQRIIAGLGELMDPAILDDPELTKVTPSPLLSWYATNEGQWFKEELVKDFGGLSVERISTIFEQGISSRGARVIKYLQSVGHPLLLGSDSPGSPGYVNQPGLNTYKELQMLAAIGIPLGDVFEAATINNAVHFGLSDEYGSVEVGKIANLLILQENPLVKVEAWNQIQYVVLHGEPHLRDTFAVKD